MATKTKAVTKKKTMKKNKKLSFSPNRKKRNLQILVFVAIFGLIGGYVIFKSFAESVSGSVQGEALANSGTVITDSAADFSKTLKLTTSAPATGTFTTVAPSTNIKVKARSTYCGGGAPSLIVVINGKPAVSASIYKGSYVDYSANIVLPEGTHTVTATYVNPSSRKRCDRAIYLDKITLVNNTPTPVTTDTTAPQVSITAPTSGTIVSGTTTVTARATDNNLVGKVEFFVSGQNNNAAVSTVTASPYNYSWDTTTVANGTYAVYAKAYDAAGNAATSASVSLTVNNATPPTSTTTKPLLLKHGFDITNPSWIQRNAASMDAKPFDGVVITLPNLSNKTLTQTPISVDTYRAALAPLKSVTFNKLKHNSIIVYSVDNVPFTGGTAIPAQNMANLATAIKEVPNMIGITLDTERYFGGTWDHPGACSATLTSCQTTANQHGRAIGQAVANAWPSATILTLFGPWISDPNACKNTGGAPCNDISWANELAGPFLNGIAETVPGFVDGGEIYTMRTDAQFEAFNAYQRSNPRVKSAGFGVYDEPWIGAPMDINIWTTTLKQALRATDKYVWAYTEKYDWWGSGWPTTPVPAAWVDATRAATTP